MHDTSTCSNPLHKVEKMSKASGDVYGCFCVNGEVLKPGQNVLDVMQGQEDKEEFRSIICSQPGATFPPAAGRYRLYVAAGCPFASRAWTTLTIMQLESAVEVVSVFPGNSSTGWFFEPTSDEEREMAAGQDGAIFDRDPEGHTHLHQLYLKCSPNFHGRVTVPVLWDTENKVIVSNNSADIAKFFATEFRQFSPVKDTLDLCPADTKDKVLAQCDRLAQDVNIQVYKAHFCPEQKVFEELCEQFWGTLDEFENLLSKQRFVLGEQMSLADIFLYVTIIRFDIVYGPMFRLNKRNVRFEMPHLWGHTRRVFQAGGDKAYRQRDILRNYFLSKPLAEKRGRTVPLGPDMSSLQP